EGIKAGGEPVTPYIADSPLVRFHRGEVVKERDELLCSSLPNLFIMNVDGVQAEGERLKKTLNSAVKEEGKAICDAVHEFLGDRDRWGSSFQGWDDGWPEQTADYWEIELAVMPVPSNAEKVIRDLGGRETAGK